MKQLLTIIGILAATIYSYAAPVKYIGCTPETGSGINTFDFTLNFDISDALTDLGEGEWGIGYIGNTGTGRYVSLYKGTQESGTEIATSLTENLNGKSEDFIIGGSSVKITFPQSIIPEENQLYTMVIRNSFAIFPSGKTIPKSETYLKYETEPLVLTFIGTAAPSNALLLQSISISDGDMIDALREIEFSFNEDIAVSNNAQVSIYDGDTATYHSELCEVDSDKTNVLKVTFADNTILYNGHNYTLSLPEGTVFLASDTKATNNSISLKIQGTGRRYYSIKSFTPENGFVGLPTKANVVFELPQDASLFETGVTSVTTLKIYEGSKSPETVIKQTEGSSIENGTGIEWSLKGISFKPSTEYILCMEKGTSSLFNADKNFMPEWSNEEVLINFITPSVEESGIPQLEFDQAVIGSYGSGSTLIENQKLASIQKLDIPFKGLVYEYNGIRYKYVTPVPEVEQAGKCKGQLYEITENGNVLVKEFPVSISHINGTYETFSMMCASLNATLYEGKQYRIVIPAGIMTIPEPSLYNYVTNPELSYTVRGTTPSEVTVTSCTVEDNAEMSELSAVVWAFNGDFTLAPDAKAMAVYKYFSNYYPLTIQTTAGTSYLMLNLNDFRTARPITLSDGVNATITVPAGILHHPTEESLTNEEIVLNIKGKTAAPAVKEPEFVTVTVLYKEDAIASENDIESVPTIHSCTLEAVKDKKFTLGFNSGDWKLGSLYRDGIDVLGMADDDGVYTTPVLKENTVIAASLEYRDGSCVTIDQTTGVTKLPDTEYSVYIEAGHIVISGLTGNETINVYNMAGIAVAETAVKDGMDTVRIGAQPGQYIVLVDKTPFKAIVR